MISFLGNWIEGIAITVIIASIFEMLLPNGNIKKYIKIILGIYVIFSIISPFVNSEALYELDVSNMIENYTEDFNISSNSTETNKKSTDENLEKMYKETFEEQIISKVEEEGYNVSSCNVEAVFNADNQDAGIKKIDITLDSKKSNSDENTSSSSENSDINKIEEIEINVSNNDAKSKTSSEVTQIDIRKLKQVLSDYYEIDKNIINIQTK